MFFVLLLQLPVMVMSKLNPWRLLYLQKWELEIHLTHHYPQAPPRRGNNGTKRDTIPPPAHSQSHPKWTRPPLPIPPSHLARGTRPGRTNRLQIPRPITCPRPEPQMEMVMRRYFAVGHPLYHVSGLLRRAAARRAGDIADGAGRQAPATVLGVGIGGDRRRREGFLCQSMGVFPICFLAVRYELASRSGRERGEAEEAEPMIATRGTSRMFRGGGMEGYGGDGGILERGGRWGSVDGGILFGRARGRSTQTGRVLPYRYSSFCWEEAKKSGPSRPSTTAAERKQGVAMRLASWLRCLLGTRGAREVSNSSISDFLSHAACQGALSCGWTM